ncbi:hypothetical protein ACFOET_01000 [Parapedobacter deserti]|uniref:Glycoside hydrolase family 42 N-terminal domain-containing protein n=1 Tax=Parapedobacter deserti TaxID=1912957 RepID=A0ABV7JDW2_9SPHI
MLGVNAFEWNFGDQRIPTHPDHTFFFKPFSSFRHYLDWRQIENDEGKYRYNPSARGNWKYDEIYQWCKEQDIMVLVCLKTIPDWLNATYPPEKRDSENVPAPYGADLSDPKSYIKFAQLGFQFAARYGANKDVDPSLVHVDPKPHYDPNEVKIGLNLIRYIECNNEPDRWWKPKKVAQQTGSEYAANMSAFYDGHKGTLGPGVGVKAADPTMTVVMGGIAAEPDFVNEMIAWCETHRGRKADGTIDLCFDVLNYHHYSNNKHETHNREKQRGVAPEISLSPGVAKRFLSFAEKDLPGIEVWNTEIGYDVNQRSSQKAIPIKGKSALVTHADWSIRSALMYARAGISKLFYYMLYDVSAKSTTQYMSSGFVDKVDGNTSRPAWYYLLQAKNLIGEYYYRGTINEDPIVDVYQRDEQTIYVLTVPDEIGREETYKLQVGKVSQVKIHELNPDSDRMNTQTVAVSGGELAIKVTETPVFVELL